MPDPTDDGDLVERLTLLKAYLISAAHGTDAFDADIAALDQVIALRQQLNLAQSQRDALAKAAEPFAAVPMRGQYGGPLVRLAAIYEDETVDRVGGFASVSTSALRALAAARAKAMGE